MDKPKQGLARLGLGRRAKDAGARAESPGNSRRILLVVLSDTHAGHREALCNPEVKLKDWDANGNETTRTPALTSSQEALWFEVYLPGLARIKELAQGAEIVVIHNGDPTWGDKHKDALVEMAQVNQVEMACSNFRPLLDLPGVKVMRLADSTQSHVYGESSADIQIASTLQKEYPEIDTRIVKHGLANIGGVLVDFAHHGPHPGTRIWLKGNVARFYLRDLMMRSIMAHKSPPDLVIRSHFHEYIEEMLTIRANGCAYRTRMIITPPMMMITDFARQKTQSVDGVTAGLVVIEIVNGEISWPPHDLMKSYDIRTKEALL